MVKVAVVDAGDAAQAAADPILAVDFDGLIAYANPATCELLSRRSLIGTRLDSLVTIAGGRMLSSLLGSTPQRVLIEVATDSGELPAL